MSFVRCVMQKFTHYVKCVFSNLPLALANWLRKALWTDDSSHTQKGSWYSATPLPTATLNIYRDDLVTESGIHRLNKHLTCAGSVIKLENITFCSQIPSRNCP